MHRSECSENRDVEYPALFSTKACHIVKRSDFEGYGFNLHSERVKPGQYVGKVDPNSPAEGSGLREGYRIIEVNGVNISQESHKQVVQRIKAISQEVRLLIVEVHANKDITTAESISPNFISPLPRFFNDNNSSKELEDAQQQAPRRSSKAISVDMIMRTSAKNYDSIATKKNNNNEHNNATIHKSTEMHFGNHYETRAQLSIKDSTAASSGGLELPMTAAEMRAKLLSKKKYISQK